MTGHKLYWRHNCPRTHPSFRSFARCGWPQARWLLGQGRYATVAYCNGPTVMLHLTSELADSALAQIGRCGCGRGCARHHEVVVLVLDGGTA